MKIGLAKVDITPRVGVELQGYGPYLCRHSDGVRDPLYARALAFEVNGERALLVSCDLIGIWAPITARVRALVGAETGLAADRIMLHAIHTHSGPALRVYGGWGEADEPYMEILPHRIARACIEALANLQEATLAHAEVPCEGIAINREYDAFRAKTVEEVLDPDWQPGKPEETDTTCHVLRVDIQGRTIGFASYYGCHPVIGGSNTRKIHGDWAGVATNLVERLRPGTTGLFLQGAQGDINACVVCPEEAEALRALDAVAARYARAILRGLDEAKPVAVDILRAVQTHVPFSRKPWDRTKLETLLAEQEAVLRAPEASDASRDVRMATVYAMALRSMLTRLLAGESLTPAIELQGLRLGPLAFLGAPFEIFRTIKNDVVAQAAAAIPLVMGFTNDSVGYAVDRTTAAKGGYAADMVPYICRQLPFANMHEELVHALLEVDSSLAQDV